MTHTILTAPLWGQSILPARAKALAFSWTAKEGQR
jgi:hypothetical protein